MSTAAWIGKIKGTGELRVACAGSPPTTVASRASLTPVKGCTVDLSDMPDMALTIAALAAIADSPTTM